jgi:pimeloyl-ACP methyl ester carboxylesterase
MPPGEDLTLSTPDGLRISATYYAVEAPNPPGVVLIHALGRDRTAWAPAVEPLVRAGIAAIAIDLRGHGDSTAGGEVRYGTFDTADWLAARQDIGAAVNALAERGVREDDIGLVGASIGANLALRYAADHPGIPAVALLSPGLDYKGITTEEAMREYGRRPVLLMTGEDDAYPASSTLRLEELAEGQVERREFPSSAHGADLLAMHPSATRLLVDWLAQMLDTDTGEAP